jgi:trigger factor
MERRLRELRIGGLLEKIMENTPVEIPESMILLELESRRRNLALRLNTSPEELDKIIKKSGQDYDEVLAEWRPAAIKALHRRLIVETLIRDLGFEVSNEDLKKEFETIAAESGSTIEEIEKYYEKDEYQEYLKEDIKERKLFDLLLAENTIRAGKKQNYLDLMENNG